MNPPLVQSCSFACAILCAACATSMRRDHMLEPRPEGTRLTGIGFIGPGVRGSIDHRVDLEPETSQLHGRLQGDFNPVFADPSVHADVRVMMFMVGGGAGYRYSWHTLRFEPDDSGLDHGERELNRAARYRKDRDFDYHGDGWPWAEAHARVALPFAEHFFALTGASFRYEDRQDNTFAWELGTVYDRGLVIHWETLLLLRHRRVGFVGPAARFLNLPRSGERKSELHLGLLAGTAPGWSENAHALFLRVFTNPDPDDQLMGTHLFTFPIQWLVGYQEEFDI